MKKLIATAAFALAMANPAFSDNHMPHKSMSMNSNDMVNMTMVLPDKSKVDVLMSRKDAQMLSKKHKGTEAQSCLACIDLCSIFGC